MLAINFVVICVLVLCISQQGFAMEVVVGLDGEVKTCGLRIGDTYKLCQTQIDDFRSKGLSILGE